VLKNLPVDAKLVRCSRTEKLNSFKVTETVLNGIVPTDNIGEANVTEKERHNNV